LQRVVQQFNPTRPTSTGVWNSSLGSPTTNFSPSQKTTQNDMMYYTREFPTLTVDGGIQNATEVTPSGLQSFATTPVIASHPPRNEDSDLKNIERQVFEVCEAPRDGQTCYRQIEELKLALQDIKQREHELENLLRKEEPTQSRASLDS